MSFKRPLGASTENQKTPNFIRPLQDKRVVVGQQVVLECQVDGHPEPVIKWLKDGQNVTQCPDYEVKQEGNRYKLIMVSTQPSDAGRFSCQASNAAGSKSSTCVIIVAPAPSPVPGRPGVPVAPSPGPPPTPIGPAAPYFVKELKHQALKVGGNAWFECRITGNPTPEMAWFKNKQPIKSAYRYKIDNNADTGICSLQISMMAAEDVGEYSCIAKNPHGQAQTSAQVMHKEKYDEWLREEQTKITTEKKRTMLAELDQQHQVGQPKPKGQFAAPQSQKLLQQHVDRHQHGDGHVSEGTWTDSDAEMENAGGPQAFPQFKQQLKAVRVNEGQDAVFQCQLSGNPRPRIQWLKNNQPLAPSQRIQIQYRGTMVMLTVKMAFPEDAGQYTIVAENQLGRNQSTAPLQVAPFGGQQPQQFQQPQQQQNPQHQHHQLLQQQQQQQPQQFQQPQQKFNQQQQFQQPQQQMQQQQPQFQQPQKFQQKQPMQQQQQPPQQQQQFQQQQHHHHQQPQQPMGQQQRGGAQRNQPQQQPPQQQYNQNQFQQTGFMRRPDEPIQAGAAPEIFQLRRGEQRLQQQRAGRREEPEVAITQPPQFSAPPKDLPNLREGQTAQFEVRYSPANDPNLRVAWLFNGKPITASSRIGMVNEFGVATLTISHVNAEDSGQYTCLAANRLGEMQAAANLNVAGRAGIQTGTIHQNSVLQIQALENRRGQVPSRGGDDGGSRDRPHFVHDLRSSEVFEGKPAHFEGKLTPSSDSNLKVEWFFNGKPLQSGSRFRVLHDFGYVALDILHTIPEDSGTYVCRATNPMGATESQAALAVIARTGVTADTAFVDQDEWDIQADSTRPPQFTAQLRDVQIQEGGRAHFEARVVPQGDPFLKVDWYKDGQPLAMANRIQLHNDFGYVSINIFPTYPEDNGVYQCVATNRMGQAQTSARLTCLGKESLLLHPQQPGSLNQIGYLESQQIHIGPFSPNRPEEIMSLEQPRFTKSPKDQLEVNEGQNVHFEGRIVPVNDPKMHVEWYFNGQPLQSGHRFRPVYDFGYAALDILYAYPEDSGTYTIICRNELGEAKVDARLQVSGKKSLYLEPQHPEGLERIQQLETARGPGRFEEPDRICTGAPQIRGQLQDQSLREDDNLHLELKVEPVNDPTMKVEWFVNGKPLTTSSRSRTTFDFGFIALDLKGLIPEDAGTYSVKITNGKGEGSATCNLQVQPKPSLLTDTQHQESVKRIQHLESLDKYGRRETEELGAHGPPSFVRQLPGNVPALAEGESLHLEAQVQPAGDNTLTIAWYKDDKPIPAGHRFRTFQDFGFCSLDIITIYPEDSGTYTLYVKNSQGEVYSQCQVECTGKESIISQTDHPVSVQRIIELETPRPKRPEDAEGAKEAPRFVQQLTDQTELQEGQAVHLECQILPTDDNQLTTTWYLNDGPLPAAHRFHPTHDFGYAALNILYIYPEDSGVYKCVARNAAGEATTQCQLSCAGQRTMYLDTCHPDSLQRIQELEAPRQALPEQADAPKQPPQFVGQLQSIESLKEGQTAHFECQVTPTDDPNLRIEWLLDGRPLAASHRFRMVHEFGYVGFDLLYVYPEDSGTYTCRAINDAGQAETSAKLSCSGRRQIFDDPHHPESWKKIKQMEETVPALPSEPETERMKPHFTKELAGPAQDIKEGQTITMHGEFQPTNDNRLKVEWLFNGQPLKHASRFRTVSDFGFASLELLYVYPEDSGTYTCRIYNDLGEATSSFQLVCRALRSLYLDTQHEQSWNRIQEIENREVQRAPSPEMKFPKPNFTQQLQNFELKEGEAVRLETHVQPVGDPSLKIQWLFNGQPINQGSRFRTTHNFDYVSLEILSVYPEDSGIYSVRAFSEFGEAVVSCTIKCEPTDKLLLDTQHQQSWQRIQEIENRPVVEMLAPDQPLTAPIFVQPLRDYPDVPETHPIHLEAQVQPTNDNKLTVQWYHNGRPIMSAHRFRVTHDFGYTSLDILYSFPEDSGTWTCKATNALGEAETTANVQVVGKHTIISDVQHPQSWQRIQEIEAPKMMPEAAPTPSPEAPRFTAHIEDQERHEGQPAHMECRLTPTTDPTMTVEWLKDGRPLPHANKARQTIDFGYISMDLAYVYPEDAGMYTVRAKNSQGEATTMAKLVVHGRDSLLLDTQHPASWQRIQEIEAGPGPQPEAPEAAKIPPRFLTQLNSNDDLVEGQPAHFEATLEPTKDNSLRVEWYHNGHPLKSSNRTTLHHDFGLVSLDFNYTIPEDAGTYACRAVNSIGEAKTEAQLQVKARSSLYLDTLHQQSLDQIKIIEAPKEMPPPPEAPVYQRPQFTQPLANVDNGVEGEAIHLECRLIPVNDPKLRLEWYFNDRPLATSNRIMYSQDFGFVSLDIAYAYAQDIGVYSCRAVNELGEAVTTASVSIQTKEGLLLDSQHPESYKKVVELEGLDKFPRVEIPDKIYEKPVFTSGLQNLENLQEAQAARLDCQVTPVGDPRLRIEWFFNGQPLANRNRIRINNDFGFCTLEIEPIYPEDSGVYTCKATNAHGEATTAATIKVEGYESILRDTQHPVSWQRIQELERPVVVDEQEVVQEKQKPQIVVPLENLDDIPDGAPLHLEVSYEPARDNTMQGEWLRNGQLIIASQLDKAKCELGRATLDISSAHADHSGLYTLRLRNSEGEAVSSCSIRVAGRSAIYDDVQHEASWQRIQEIEAPKPAPEDVPAPVYPAPNFLGHLADVQVGEGDPVRFACQVQPVADPSLRIEWYVNGQQLTSGSKYAITMDFGFVSLDILYAIPEDSGMYMCKAINAAGEAVTSATLHCTAKDSIILTPQQPASVARIAELEAPKPFTEAAPDKAKGPPVFVSQLADLGEVTEGHAAHFEANVTPQDDNTLRIQWLLNGRPVAASSRLKMVNDFGFCVLDIQHVEPRDTGEWTCKATNAAGEATTTGHIRCSPRETLILTPQQPQSLARIEELERPKGVPEPAPAKAAQPPKFVVPLPAFPPLEEGDSVHLEAQVTPVDDPKMRIEWLRNGQVLVHGHRFRPVNDFGFCVLDILYVLAEDSGEFTCRATNEVGSDTTTVQLQCAPKSGLILHPQVREEKAKAVNDLEEWLHRTVDEPEVIKEKVAPVFVQPLQNPPPLREGENAYFSARVTPTNDPELKIKWYLNGNPLVTGSRVKTISDFGFVILEISPVYPEDSGEYVCKATNSMGEAVTAATMTCEGKERLILTTQLPSQMSGAQEKINILEAPKPLPEDMPDPNYGAPKFVSNLVDMNDLVEGQLAHFEARLEPANDPHLKVEWFHNDVPVFHSARMKMIHDFGFVILEIAPAEPQDTGVFTCKAKNQFGECTTQANVKVEGRSGVVSEWQMPDHMHREKITELEDYLHRVIEPIPAPDKVFDVPVFTNQLPDLGELTEADAGHFECQVEPIGDPTLRIEWLHNGQPVPYSSRIHMQHDFGVVVLHIKHLIPEDSGEYVCKASNSKGQSTTTGKLVCRSRREVEAPQFATPLMPEIPGVQEGDTVHLECRVTPITDPRLQIHWYFNGKPLVNASRFKTIHEFGFVSLDILHAYAEDTGTYMCKAVNEKGEAQTETHVDVSSKPSLILQRQAPKQTMPDLERHLRQYTTTAISLSENDYYQEGANQPPRFVTQLQNLAITEGEFARFECQLAPISDPHLKVEWFLNGKPIMMGHRFLPIHDHGYVALALLYALPDDTGEFVARAVNKYGKDMTKAKLVCAPTKRVITESQLPQGMNVASISKLEEQLYWTQTMELEDQPKAKLPPVFTIPPRHVQAYENEPARFECAVVGFPKPRVHWYINGRPVVHGIRFKLNYDGMHYFTIPQVVPQDAGDIICVAKNSEGESQALANLDVLMVHDFREHRLKSASRTTREELDIREERWRTDALGSLGDAFERAPKPDLGKLVRIEGDKQAPAPLESEELVQKFHKQRHEDFYEKITAADRPREVPPPLPMETVQLKPSKINVRELPREEMEKVGLRPAPRVERTAELPPELPWLKPQEAKPALSSADEERKFKLKPAPPKEVEVKAKDQVTLKTVKPKPADQPAPEEHVEIPQPDTTPKPPRQLPAPPKEENIPASKQVSLKPAFAPKDNVIGESVQIEDVQFKPAMVAPKMEENKNEKIFVKQPTKQGQTSKQPPVFTQKVQPIKSEVGRAARFYCEFAGDQPMKVIWMRDGKTLAASFEFQIKSSETTSALEIPKVKPEYAGNYTARVENVAGRADSSANLLVIDRADMGAQPQFTQVMADTKVSQGHPARLDCRITGTPSPAVTWYKDGKQITPDNRLQTLVERDQFSLLITEALPQDSGTYECIARNPKGESRCISHVTVALAKGAGPPQQPRGAAAGQPQQPQAPAPGQQQLRPGQQPQQQQMQQQQQRPGQQPQGQQAQQQQQQRPGQPPQAQQPGQQQPQQQQQQQQKGSAPKVLEPIKPLVLQEGKPAQFSAKISGSPDPTVKWFRNNAELKPSKFASITRTGDVYTLTINECHKEEEGEYKCEATNASGKTVCAATLKLQPKPKMLAPGGQQPPQFTQLLQDLTAKAGEKAKFTAAFNGSPAPQVTWLHNGRALQGTNDINITTANNQCSLELQRVADANQGKYTCRLNNPIGQAESSASLKLTPGGGGTTAAGKR